MTLYSSIMLHGGMFIYVKSLYGDKYQINVDEDCTVKEVKLIYQEKEGIAATELRIIFKGKLLNDTDKLRERGVKAGMTLHTVIMLRGT